MYVGNVVLLILNLPLVGLFVNLLRVPYPCLYPAILVFSILGVYAVNGSVVDVWIMLAMGVLGYVLRKLDFETAPIVLGLVLAPMLELTLRQSLAMSDGALRDLRHAARSPPRCSRSAPRSCSSACCPLSRAPRLARAARPGRERRRAS